MSENAITVFNNNYMATMQRYADLEQTIKDLDATKKKVRAELQRAMEDYGIRSIENDICKITVVAESDSITIDTSALRISKPDVYDDLVDAFPKHMHKNAFLRVTIK